MPGARALATLILTWFSKISTKATCSANNKENIKAPHCWPWWGEYTSEGGFPSQMAIIRKAFPCHNVIMVCLYGIWSKWLELYILNYMGFNVSGTSFKLTIWIKMLRVIAWWLDIIHIFFQSSCHLKKQQPFCPSLNLLMNTALIQCYYCIAYACIINPLTLSMCRAICYLL